MIKTLLTLLFPAILCIVSSSSCRKQNEAIISAHGSSDSHNMGRNCMDCHKKGGQGNGWFIIAGNVFDTIFPNNKLNPNVTIYLLL